MNAIGNIPYSTAEFDKHGRQLKAPDVPPGTTDVIIVSHGWNNDRTEAEALYTKLFTNLAQVTAGDDAMRQRKLAIVGVIWPSKKFDELVTQSQADARAGGAASAARGDKAATQAAIGEAIDRAAPVFDDNADVERLARLRDAAARLDDEPEAQEEFVATLRELASGSGVDADDADALFLRGDASAIFERASHALPTASTAGSEAGTGAAAGLGDFFSKSVNSVVNLLNLTTYYKMKERAGTVGQKGVGPLVDQLAAKVDRIHLVGHSFGGRLVTAAAANSTTPDIRSLSLLQAAFSHNAFSKLRKGFFRNVVEGGRVHGPIVITHTANDTAVGKAYAIASRISNTNASALGDANDEFGGIGRNGAQQMEPGEVVASTARLLPVGGTYAWAAGRCHNLESSQFIRDPDGGDAHGFVFVPEVAWAISRAFVA